MVNIRQASKLLGIKVRTVRQWIHDGKIKAGKYDVSNRWFIEESEIERIIMSRTKDDNEN